MPHESFRISKSCPHQPTDGLLLLCAVLREQLALQLFQAVAFLDLEVCTLHSQGIIRHVLGDGRTCGGICTLTQFHRSNQIGVAADKAVVADDTALLFQTVIVYCNGTAAEVYLLAHIAVAHIGEVCDGGLLAYGGVLDLYEVTDLDAVLEVRVRTDMNERTSLDRIFDLRLKRLDIVQCDMVADLAVLDEAVRANGTLCADLGFSSQTVSTGNHTNTPSMTSV